MRKFVLDTNIIIHLVRNSDTWKLIDRTYKPINAPNESYLSFATLAEIHSLSIQLNWGIKKQQRLEDILANFTIVNIDHRLLLPYIEIDTFSQGKHPSMSLPLGLSARNMGKNDIWIAATALALKAELLTTDKDFEHLKGVLEDVHCVVMQ
ncbi:MAG: PIN domain-containing protein [Chitinophagales bacterium]